MGAGRCRRLLALIIVDVVRRRESGFSLSIPDGESDEPCEELPAGMETDMAGGSEELKVELSREAGVGCADRSGIGRYEVIDGQPGEGRVFGAGEVTGLISVASRPRP